METAECCSWSDFDKDFHSLETSSISQEICKNNSKIIFFGVVIIWEIDITILMGCWGQYWNIKTALQSKEGFVCPFWRAAYWGSMYWWASTFWRDVYGRPFLPCWSFSHSIDALLLGWEYEKCTMMPNSECTSTLQSLLCLQAVLSVAGWRARNCHLQEFSMHWCICRNVPVPVRGCDMLASGCLISWGHACLAKCSSRSSPPVNVRLFNPCLGRMWVCPVSVGVEMLQHSLISS